MSDICDVGREVKSYALCLPQQYFLISSTNILGYVTN